MIDCVQSHRGTRASVNCCAKFEAKSILTELLCKEEELCLPSSSRRLGGCLDAVYAGRVPALAVERLNAVESNGATCVIVAVYGNKAAGDALVEMQDVATAQGFNVVAAVAANAEHSICRMYGAGRPAAADAGELASFGRAILERVQGGKPFGHLALPGNRPYKQGCSGPFPVANQDCTECGVCASQCPTGAISADNPKDNNNQLCIGCMRCVSVCPSQARGIGEFWCWQPRLDSFAVIGKRTSCFCVKPFPASRGFFRAPEGFPSSLTCRTRKSY